LPTPAALLGHRSAQRAHRAAPTILQAAEGRAEIRTIVGSALMRAVVRERIRRRYCVTRALVNSQICDANRLGHQAALRHGRGNEMRSIGFNLGSTINCR